ncbi:MAG: N-acetylmuramoyl-L-alanine amidase [Gemmatimonadales bacterium]|nr:N-acetylmuramoyl-L-alanine amidase [Gemmatimonadales bacterium]
MLPQSADLPLRTRPVRAIVIHTATAVFARKVAQDIGTDDPARLGDGAVARYERLELPFYGHVLVDGAGAPHWLAPVDRVAWHTAPLADFYATDRWRLWARPPGEGWTRHGRDPARVWDWWDARWPGVESPRLLATGRQPNDVSIGVDLLPTVDGEFTPCQMQAANRLVLDLCCDHDVPHLRGYVLGHEDVDPCGRGAVRRRGIIYGVPWDPGPRLDWTLLGLES